MTPREARALLWRLAWPVAITGQLASLAEAINIYWLGHLLGNGALAVEATLRPVVQCVQWTLVSIATGVSVLVAQSVGARNGRGLTYTATGMRMVIVASIGLAILVLPLCEQLAELLAPAHVEPAELLKFGLPALLLMTPGLTLVLVVLNAATGAGWTRLATIRMAIDLCATALLVPVLIHVLGIAGAPIAQACVQLVMLVLVWRTLYAHRERWHLGDTSRTRDGRAQAREILAIGLPIQIARIFMFATYTYLVQHVATEGRPALVGFGLALMVYFYGINFVGSIGRATGIAVGQAVGAKDFARARIMLRTGLMFGTLAGGVIALTTSLLARHLIGLWTGAPVAVGLGTTSLHILALALIPLGGASVYMFALAAIKATRRAALVGVAADAVGVVFAITWPSDDALAIASWSIVLSTMLRVVLYAVTSHTMIARSDTLDA